jgi:hypothetical protein
MHVRQSGARHVQPHRFGAGRYQQRSIVGHGAAILRANETLLRVYRDDTRPKA